MSKKPFEKTTVGGIEVRNRLVRSATHETMADNGKPSPAFFDLYRNLSSGGVGLIITGYMTFSETDNTLPQTVQLDNDDRIPALESLTKIVHDNGAKIVAQLSHLGSQILWTPDRDVYAPSNIMDPLSRIIPKPLSTHQIESLVKEFGTAALRAKRAGFDGVQIHGAHGYLLSRFLSPAFNKRSDPYGGSQEKNVKILMEILKQIKHVCGDEFPVWFKINCEDFGHEDNGLDFELALKTAEMLHAGKADAIELSGGTSAGRYTPARSKDHVNYHLGYAEKMAKAIGTPIISVGGFRDMEAIEAALHETKIEAVSLCRPLIREPDLPKLWMENQKEPAKCISCNGCTNPTGTKCLFSLHEGELKAQKAFLKAVQERRKQSS